MEAAEFHTLTVSDVARLTDEAVAVTLDVPDDLVEKFSHLPGQHVTIRASIHGEDVRRSYSICVAPRAGELRVGIKKLQGGVFSTWANEGLTAGAKLDVMPPVGDFVIRPDPGRKRHVAAIAAGSGITPILAVASSLLEEEPMSRFTLVFGNRASRSVMFLEEIEGLKDRYPDRFNLIHILSREETAVPLFSGRIDRSKLEQLLDLVIEESTIHAWYLCGPHGMVEEARTLLLDRGARREAVLTELFFNDAIEAPPPEPEDTAGMAEVRFTLEGRASTVHVDPDGRPILDHALQVRRELPFSCRGGMCTTCRARVTEGAVEMEKNWSLTADELAQGYILTCQAHPTTDRVELTFDV